MSEHTFEFLVKGSEPVPYIVKFSKIGGKLKATCSCRAGIMGQLCKHRLSILAGDSTSIVSDNRNDVSNIQNFLIGTDTEALLDSIKQIEDEKKIIEDKLKQYKKKVAKSLS